MKRGVMFLVVGVLLIAGCSAVLLLVFPGEAARRAIGLAALIALMVQLLTWALLTGVGRENVVAGWGAGALLRLVVLGVFALLVVPRLQLPAAAAMVSLALFFFVTTLVEPLFLKS